LLKQKLRLSANDLRSLARASARAFAVLVYGNVRSFV